MAMIRLNKVLARAGVASRRQADEMISAGRVTVNGDIVRGLGTRVDSDNDEVRVDGESIPAPEPTVVLAFHKPRYVVSTTSDPEGRDTVLQLIDRPGRLFIAGRLDFESEGLLIVTNEGELANRLMHPKYGHEKEYRVKISGTPTDTALRAWRDGMFLEDGKTAPARVKIESSTGGGTWMRFVLREGKKRQVRRMVEAMSHSVHRLIRVRMGQLVLGNLAPGHYRELSPAEYAALVDESVSGTPAASRPAGGKPKYGKGWARPRQRKKLRGRKPRDKRR